MFPTNPTNNELYKDYYYDSTLSAWKKVDPGKYFDVGFIYVQLPNEGSPSDRGWYGTWTNISSNYAGDFFRVEGGAASAFESGEQLDQLQGHYHRARFETTTRQSGGSGTRQFSASNYHNGTFVDTVQEAQSDGTNGTPRLGSETRPVNQTIRVWKRTA
jgi:hypothetical protein